MLLVLDIGNTNVVAALYEGNRQMGLWRFASDDSLADTTYQVLLAESLGDAIAAVDGVIIASVVPGLTSLVQTATQRLFACRAMVVGCADVDVAVAATM